MSGSEKRRAATLVRVTLETRARLEAERDARGLRSFDQLIEELLPKDQQKTGTCNYCGVTMRQPGNRHRYHSAKCALWKDKEYPVHNPASKYA